MSDVGFSWVDRMPWQFDEEVKPIPAEVYAELKRRVDDDQIGANVD